jgi:RNA polymerase sigma factor (sigma-70 family)
LELPPQLCHTTIQFRRVVGDKENVLTDRRIEFERLIMPHMAAAYNLARWLMRHPQDAEDVVQEAYLKAFKSFDRYAGGNAKAWILVVVRNTAMTRLSRRPPLGKVVVLHDIIDGVESGAVEALRDPGPWPDAALVTRDEQQIVHRALAQLPQPLREVLVLREFDDLSYHEIADIIGAPIGTVMSRLARARTRMRHVLTTETRDADDMAPRKKEND